MDTTITAVDPSSASSPSSSKQWKHDVFLSFRGEDTRRTFTDNLYWTLKDNKVNVFIDENELPRGENITDELVEAIRLSRMSVVIFSKRYAESRWCLEELEMIMECRRKLGQIVLPIFYNVDPTDVRNQTGSVAEAFQKHAERFHGDTDKVQRWRSAFTEAANLCGGNLRNTDGYEGKFIRKIVNDITRKLNNTYLNVAAKEIGIDSRVQEIIDDLDVGGSDDVRIVGILGMVGTGKTMVAKAIFNRVNQSFEGKSFLSKVREESMVKLQNQLLCDILKPANIEVSSVDQGTKEIQKRLGSIRVLVIIDDIDCVGQLEELAIKHESFGRGSRIIVTTRDEQLLKFIRVDKTCLAQTMNNEEALQLLSWRAFKKSHPNDDEYLELAKKVVDYCGGLPLALEVLGSYLSSKSKREWRSALRKLKRKPHGKIYEKLKMSYDGLIDDDVKAIFLDISCFFIGMNKDYVMTILDGCDFNPDIGIGELHDRCLVTVDEGNNLTMHDLLRDMGREIVRAKSPTITGKRCRLWDHDDVKDVLRNKSGTEDVEGLTLDLHESDEPSFSTEALREMRSLRLLILKGVKFTGNCTYLSKTLTWLCWPEFPLEVMPEDFNPPNLVDVDLSHSQMQVWKDPKDTLKKLKFLNLGYCCRLKWSPDFSKLPNIERLILRDCTSLSEIHPSIVQLKCLKYLSLANSNLTSDAFPEGLGSISSLEVLDLRGNDFTALPILTGLSKLQTLQLDNCTKLQAIPDLPTRLEILEANQCIALERMPDFSEMSRLRELHLNHSPKLTEIPGLDKSLTSMTRIHMEGCTNLNDAFKEAILRGWSASGNGGLFLPGPSLFRGLQPKEEIKEHSLDCESMSYSSEYKEGRNDKAARPDDDSYDENRSHKRIRFDLSIGSNAEEETVAGEYNCIIVQNHKSCMEADAIFEEGGDGEDEEEAPSAVLVSVNCSSSGTDQKYKFGIS